jgi:hypothetical protein
MYCRWTEVRVAISVISVQTEYTELSEESQGLISGQASLVWIQLFGRVPGSAGVQKYVRGTIGNCHVRSSISVEVSHSERKRVVAGRIIDRRLEATVTVAVKQTQSRGPYDDHVQFAIPIEVGHGHRVRGIACGIRHGRLKRAVAIPQKHLDVGGPASDDQVKLAVLIQVRRCDRASPTNEGSYLATGDFNGDGKLDLAVTVLRDFAEAVLLGNGDGSFQNGVEYSTASGPFTAITADFNGDGILDLVAVAGGDLPGQGYISVLLGTGNGTFQTHVDYPIPTNFSSGIATGDLNGDGVMDLLVTSPPGGHTTGLPSVAVTYVGQGDGTFRNKGYFATGLYPVSIAVGDFNGDGMLDIVTANPGDNTVSVLLQITAVLSRTQITFPNTKVGSSKTARITFSNIGKSSFTIGKFSLNGNGASAFSQTNNCGIGLTSGASCTIKITFAPTSGRKLRSVRLQINDSAANVPQTVYLQGAGVAN